ncbi:MAG: hypothetical protein VR70_04065 [Rhodospirillaceae bacterium BRH_c57]|nr:MAG: hypothetical protein VR70_04065 [Rhodospirillaceae bacterium BRH_c57]
MDSKYKGRNPNLDYLDHFGADGRKILWDTEATGVVPILMTECFAGVGAPYVASSGLPIKTVAISEHSGLAPSQCAVWATRAPEVTNLDDITAGDFVPRMMELLEEEKRKNPLYGLNPVTAIFGGSPCQAFSFAGKRQGLRDDRGNLALRYANVAIEGGYDIVGWENVVGALSDKTNGFGHLIGLLSGLSRMKIDWSPLICDDRFLKAVEASEGLASQEEGVIDLPAFMDSNPHAAEALLTDEGFKAVACADTVKAEVLADDLKAKVKAGDVACPKAAKAVLSGDRQAFLDAMAESSDPIDECLIHLAPFCTAAHELVSPESWWTKVMGKHGQRWPSAGVVVGPERVLAWRVMDAQEYGVPQRRKRVFLFAVKAGSGLDPTKFLFDFPEGVSGEPGFSRKPDLVVDGEKGKVMVFVPDVKMKKFGTSIEPHWGG